MSLKARLEREIAAAGPITVADFMRRALHDPQDGYYATRPRLGADGDFVTAPMVSQMFGELIGLWAAETWARLGSPPGVRFVEMGPGDGTLMQDALRALRVAPEFLAAADVVLVETSEPLRQAQQARLGDRARWVERLADLAPGGPVILIANELLDCLPARQFLRTDRGWAERMVGLDDQGALAFGLRPAPPPAGAPANLPVGLVWETSPEQEALGLEIGALIAGCGGAALMIDYGRDVPAPGDTLQALKAHMKVDPLEAPGDADLTVWADFPAIGAAACQAGAATTAVLTQGLFLERLGIRERAAALAEARPDRAETLRRQLSRLVDADAMGSLFKALAVHVAGAPVPLGFEEPHP